MAFVLASAPAANHEETSGLTSSSADDMKTRPKLEILLEKDTLFLKGTGVDVESALLSGRVALYLAESCSIKEITLQFRGKAHCSAHDSNSTSASALTYVVCDHHWSFLEGEKKHNHTLKAGRHFFPFSLQLGGSLPSSISTRSMGGSSVSYKLKAHVTRSGFSHNLQTTAPVSIVRSFTSEALEYQQSLELENTWPEKIMYSLMVPHKAWAAGDTLTSVFKYSPLAKGVRVVSITSSIQETVKMFGRPRMEQTRMVATVKHDICEGRAVEVSRQNTPGSSGTGTPVSTPHHRSTAGTGGYFSITPHVSSSTPSPPLPEAREAGPPVTSHGTRQDDDDDGNVTAFLNLNIPCYLTPTHSLDPIIVNHRIRWNILILNLDGHTSELRCSLPLCILDRRLLEESRRFSAQTRRLLLGGPEMPTPADEDMELPSYNAHLRDRVANQYLPESATMRVTNPWVFSSVSPVMTDSSDGAYQWPRTASGHATPLEAQMLSHLPSIPRSGDSTPLDWVNSELLLSLTGSPPPVLSAASRASPPPQSSESQLQSRLSSRSASPDRLDHHRQHVTGPNATYVHNASHASRNLHSLFKTSMKPLSSISNPFSSRSHSHSSLSTMTSLSSQPPSGNSHILLPDPNSGSALLHRAFTEVPDYQVASRGFIGGVPPLTSMAGLPSYAEASQSGTRSSTPSI